MASNHYSWRAPQQKAPNPVKWEAVSGYAAPYSFGSTFEFWSFSITITPLKDLRLSAAGVLVSPSEHLSVCVSWSDEMINEGNMMRKLSLRLVKSYGLNSCAVAWPTGRTVINYKMFVNLVVRNSESETQWSLFSSWIRGSCVNTYWTIHLLTALI